MGYSSSSSGSYTRGVRFARGPPRPPSYWSAVVEEASPMSSGVASLRAASNCCRPSIHASPLFWDISFTALSVLLGHRREVPALLALHQVVEALDALLDRDKVREESTEPPLIHEVHSGALGFLRDRLLRLLLRSDEEDLPAVRGQVSHEDVGLFDARERLLKVDDVDAVALHEDEALHLWVPAASLVSEVHAGLQELLHRDDCHVCVSLVPPPAMPMRGTGKRAKYRASCSISINSSWLQIHRRAAGPVSGSGLRA